MLRDVSTADEQGRGGVRSLDLFDQRLDPVSVKTLLDVSTDAADEGAVCHVEDLYSKLGRRRLQQRCARRVDVGHRPVVP
jgi:hypothetical protein